MTPPTVHFNGTSRESLMDGYEAAWHALEKAYQAIKETAPNGRDFYPQGNAAMNAATEEHFARLRKVDEVKAEISELLVAISSA
jgi:hypothetical protein